MRRLLPLLLLALSPLAALLSPEARASASGPLGSFASGLDEPRDIQQLADGRILIADIDADRVRTFSPDGTDLGDFGSGHVRPNAIAELSDGRVLVTSFELDPTLDAVGAFASDGTYLGDFATALDRPHGIAQLADGRVLVVEFGFNRIMAYASDGTPLGVFADGLDQPTSIAQHPDGRVLVSETGTPSEHIRAFDTSGTSLGVVASVGQAGFHSVLSDGSILIGDTSLPQAVRRFAADGTPLGVFADGLSSPLASRQLADGRVLVTERTGNIAAFEDPTASGGTPDIDISYISSTRDPQRGEALLIRASATNNEAVDVRTRVYFTVEFPTGVDRTKSVFTVNFPAGETVQIHKVKRIRYLIPADAPAGTYTVTLYAAADRASGGAVYDSDSFTFDLPPVAPKAGSRSPEASGAAAGPNPFRSETTIRYTLADDAEVDLRVFDVTGREVAALASGVQGAGAHAAAFAAGDLPNGVYVWRLVAGGEVTTGRVTLAR